MFMTKINNKTYKSIRNTIDNKNILFRRTTPQYGHVGSFSNNVGYLSVCRGKDGRFMSPAKEVTLRG